MKLKEKISRSFIGVFMAALAITLSFTSCDDDDTTDSTGFALYYTSLTDISPSMNGTIASPTFKGSAPSNFAITKVTFGEENEAYTGSSFTVDAETGVISISNTNELKVGKYNISVSCMTGSKTHYYDNAVTVNFMKAVPDGITVEPNEIRAEYADVLDKDSNAKLATAQISTDGNHISITGYQISNIKKGEEVLDNFPDPMFSISGDGVISIVKGCKRFEVGTYVVSLKLNTAVAGGDSELGLFHDAVKVNITSKPLSLKYNPAEDLIEEETDEVSTEYINKEAPAYVGSTEGVNFSIESVSPAEAKDKFSIAPATGIISVAKGHGFKNGSSYKVSVRVKNEFCAEGIVFENAFSLKTVEFIQPIENFNYAETSIKQAVKISINKAAEFKGGGNLSFRYADEADKKKYEGVLTLNEKTGEISAPKYNTLAIGTYNIGIVAENNKGKASATVKLNIVENENYFTYISYGNNISENQTPTSEFDNQYRFHKDSELEKTFAVKTDAKDLENIKWSVAAKNQMKGTTINDKTGELTTTKEGWAKHQVGYVFVTATKGEGEESISRTIPVFFHCAGEMNGVTVEFTPFVLHINPKVGGRSAVPAISNKEGFLLDYRRTFVYQNLNGVREDGTELESGVISSKSSNNPFLMNLFKNVAGFTNYGAKLPLSYYDSTGKTRKTDDVLNNKTLAYVDNDATGYQYSVVVPANAWYDNGWADGVFTGQMTFVNTNVPADLGGSKNQIFPLAIWFDKNL